MITLIQRVSHAEVLVENQVVGAIQFGILALIGIEKSDTEKQAERLLQKILTYRIFEDANKKMNLNLKDVNGGLLLVSQFTLVANTKNGTRPGFEPAMAPEPSQKLFSYLVKFAEQYHQPVAQGVFGKHMNVELCNEGPATFLLRI